MRRLPLLLLLAVIPATARSVPPTNVSGRVGPAERSRVDGPGWVCAEDFGVALAAGETAYVASVGIHSVGWRVVAPRGEIVVTESDAFRMPEEAGRRVPDTRGRRIYRYGVPGAFRYMIWGIVRLAGRMPVPAILVEGPGLTGGRADHALLDRIEARPQPARCRLRVLRLRFDSE
jgi:hypothetical protein